jgi:hypothetical protein
VVPIGSNRSYETFRTVIADRCRELSDIKT